MLVTCRVLKDL